MMNALLISATLLFLADCSQLSASSLPTYDCCIVMCHSMPQIRIRNHVVLEQYGIVACCCTSYRYAHAIPMQHIYKSIVLLHRLAIIPSSFSNRKYCEEYFNCLRAHFQ